MCCSTFSGPRQLFVISLALSSIVTACLMVLTFLSSSGSSGDSGGYRLRVQEAPLPPTMASNSWLQRRQLRMRWPLKAQLVRELVPYLAIQCGDQAPCLAFGSPLFHRWRSWLPLIDEWTARGQAACGVSCDFVADASAADAVLFHGRDLEPKVTLSRQPEQFWIYVNMESPLATRRYGYDVSADPKFRFLFNWTATTSSSSSIQLPYGAWEPRPSPLPAGEPLYSPSSKKHLAFVALSNCKHSFNNRTAKIAQLQKLMELHVYGTCGDRQLSRNVTVLQELSKQYRFYLSFENAFCRDYITEKLHSNGLESHAVPVAFGGLSRADYERVSPPNSFVYALDFASVKQLADHLTGLAADESRYARLLEWKRRLRAAPSASMLCAICRKLHEGSAGGPAVADLSEFSDVERNCRPADSPYLL